mgnify:CR=1 FL=1
MLSLLTKVTIDGTDVTSYLTNDGYEVVDSIKNEASTGSISFNNKVFSNISLTTSMTVVVTRGFTTSTDHTIFKGYTTNITKDMGVIGVECMDKLWLLNRNTKNQTFDKTIDTEAGVTSAIAETLIEDVGLTASVETTTTVLDKFVCKDDIVLERVLTLAKIDNFYLYYNPSEDVVHWESKGYTTYPTTLIVGTHIVEVPVWEYNYEDMANWVKINGATQEVEDTMTFSGDGVTDDFLLDYEPESVKVFVGGTLQTGGVVGSSSSYDYYVDKSRKKIIFVSGSIPGVGVDNIEVRYSYLIPRSVIMKDDDSIAAYGTYKLVKEFKDIESVDDAESRAVKILDRRKNPQVSTKLKIVGVSGLTAGMNIIVEDDINNEYRTVLVKRVRYKYPGGYDEVEAGDEVLTDEEIIGNVNERLRRIERERLRDSEIVNTILNFNRIFNPKRRYIKLTKKEIDDNTCLIWKHPTQGLWGSFNWCSDPFGSSTTEIVVWPSMNYIETFKTSDFDGESDGAGSGTWDTTSKTLTFT